MLFNSQLFLLCFLPLTVIIYWFVATRKYHNKHSILKVLLLIASLIFYGYWDIRLLPLLLISICINYLLIQALLHFQHQKNLLLFLGIAINIAVLGFFKYFNFFVINLQYLGIDIKRMHIILPLAISFFTFQQIATLVAAKKRQICAHSFLDYALFIGFFPQLIAGPIVYHNHLVPQLQSMPHWQNIANKFATGLILLILGLLKKVLFADTLGTIADPLFHTSLTQALTIVNAWIAALAFGLQIYFDFSGYSDMAIGIALLFGIELPINFNIPYRATSLIDFWHRWHITLSTFLRDYLYIPLGGNRYGATRRSSALMITMLLGGLWHGAGWNYIIWGGLHGIGLVMNHLWNQNGINLSKVSSWLLTILFVFIAFVIFRAESIISAFNVITSLFGFGITINTDYILNSKQIALLACAFIVAIVIPEPHYIATYQFWHYTVVAIALAIIFVLTVIYLGGSLEQEFIYFQF